MTQADCDNSDVIRELLDMLGRNASHGHAFSKTTCNLYNDTSQTERDLHNKHFLGYVDYNEIEPYDSGIGHALYAYLTPFIIIIGVLGNVMSLCVFLSRRLRGLSASHYLIALSASDTLVLSTYVLFEWLSRGLPRWPGNHSAPIRDTNGICQLFLFISYTSRFVSVYLVLVFTIERYIAVCKPLQRRMICTRNFAKKLIAIVVITGMAISIPKPLLSGVYRPHEFARMNEPTNTESTTAYSLDYLGSDPDDFIFFFEEYKNTSRFQNFPSTIQPDDTYTIEPNQVCMRNIHYDRVNIVLEIAYSILITAVPFALLLFFNLLIMRRLVRRFSATNKLDISFRENRIRWEFTVMLLVVSSCFILLNIPYFIVWIIQFQHSVHPRKSTVIKLSNDVHLTKTIFYLNYCINFFLYCLTGSHYRNVIREWFLCGAGARRQQTHASASYYQYSSSLRKFSHSLSLTTQSTFV